MRRSLPYLAAFLIGIIMALPFAGALPAASQAARGQVGRYQLVIDTRDRQMQTRFHIIDTTDGRIYSYSYAPTDFPAKH